MNAIRIALLGAESTGKTALAATLAERLAQHTGWRCTWVPEWLRTWCDRAGRTPRRDEQRAIAEQQQAREKLGNGDRDGAGNSQGRAVAYLDQAIREVEEDIRQRRQEEHRQQLEDLLARARRMLAMQTAVREGTAAGRSM